MNLLGIDPDLKGGLALVNPQEGSLLALVSVPVLPVKKPIRKAAEVDIQTLHDRMMQMRRSFGVDFVVLEAATVRGQKSPKGEAMMGGVGRVFTTYGTILAVASLVFGRRSIVDAHPASWKRAMGLSSDKSDSRRKAGELHPMHAALFSKTKNTGLAEATLLAHWGLDRCTRVHRG